MFWCWIFVFEVFGENVLLFKVVVSVFCYDICIVLFFLLYMVFDVIFDNEECKNEVYLEIVVVLIDVVGGDCVSED